MNPIARAFFNRREAIKTIGAGLALAGLATFASAVDPAPAVVPTAPPAPPSPWDLPKLPFDYDALEPHIDALTMQIHHAKHHQAYITNAKKLLEPHPEWRNRTPEFLIRNLAHLPEVIRPGVRNHVGGHVNHAFFWTILGRTPDPYPVNTIAEAIKADFGSFEKFQEKFTDAALKRFGSGWAWLVTKDRHLSIISTANQDSPLSDGYTPLLALDVWEHAYYLHYQNRRPDYVAAFWKVINWPQVDTYYQASLQA